MWIIPSFALNLYCIEPFQQLAQNQQLCLLLSDKSPAQRKLTVDPTGSRFSLVYRGLFKYTPVQGR